MHTSASALLANSLNVRRVHERAHLPPAGDFVSVAPVAVGGRRINFQPALEPSSAPFKVGRTFTLLTTAGINLTCPLDLVVDQEASPQSRRKTNAVVCAESLRSNRFALSFRNARASTSHNKGGASALTDGSRQPTPGN